MKQALLLLIMLVAGFSAQAQLTNAQDLVAGLRVPAAMKKSSRQSAEAYATPAAYRGLACPEKTYARR